MHTISKNQNFCLLLYFSFFVFTSGTKKAIAYTKSSAFWTSNTKYFDCFTKSSLKNALKQLILERYFTIGNVILP